MTESVTTMDFGYLGVRYNETPLSVRELVSFTDSKKTEFFDKMQRIGVKQCMVLSTCNRSEIFFFYPTERISGAERRSVSDGSSRGCGTQPAPFWCNQIYDCYAGCFPEADIKE